MIFGLVATVTLSIAVTLGVPAALAAGECASAPYHQFDFFVGHWNVYNTKGDLVGSDVVDKVLNGCAIHEQYADASSKGGGVGVGLSGYQISAGRWYQDFMDDSGMVVTLWGRPNGSAAMVLDGEDYPKSGKRLDRGIWTVHGATVEELWLVSTDDGKTWKTLFHGYFRPRP